jgi:hypothetical protein
MAIRGGGLILAVALISGAAAAADDDKPMFTPADQRILAEYRMSMDTAKRCYEAWKSALQGADNNPGLRKELAEQDTDDDAETIPDMLKAAETHMPNTSAAIKRGGCTMRDTIVMFMEATAVEAADLAKQMGGDAKEFSFIPPETVAFFEKNGETLRGYVDDIEQLHREKFPEAHKDDD